MRSTTVLNMQTQYFIDNNIYFLVHSSRYFLNLRKIAKIDENLFSKKNLNFKFFAYSMMQKVSVMGGSQAATVQIINSNILKKSSNKKVKQGARIKQLPMIDQKMIDQKMIEAETREGWWQRNHRLADLYLTKLCLRVGKNTKGGGEKQQ